MKSSHAATVAWMWGLLAASTALAAPKPSGTALLWDDFALPFSVGTPTSKWFYFQDGAFVANDGLTQSDMGTGGMAVWPPGWGTETGDPVFSLTVPPDSATPGQYDHVKWLAYMNHAASTGIAGFDATAGKELACEVAITGWTYGTHRSPFPQVVAPLEDPRLASFAQNTIDFETGMVFDFFFTNKRIYVLYERLPFARTATNHYAAFTYMIPVGWRTSIYDWHNAKIAYNPTAGTVRWLLNGVEVFRVSQLGRRLDRQWMAIDHGGTEQTVAMRQLNCGMGLFTLLDASLGGSSGLVRLSGAPSFYFQTAMGEPNVTSFADEYSLPNSRLFQQGAQFQVRNYKVTYTPVP